MRHEHAFLSAHRGTGEGRQSDEIRGVDHPGIAQDTPFGDIRRMHAVEQQDGIDAREMLRLEEDGADGAVTGRPTGKSETSDPWRRTEGRRELARDRREE